MKFPLLVELSVDGVVTMVETVYAGGGQDRWHPELVPEKPKSLPRLMVSDANGKRLDFELFGEEARRVYRLEEA